MAKKCVIIGGGGFIGTVLADVLSKNNRKVVIIDKKYNNENEFLSSVEFLQGDYNDTKLLAYGLNDAEEIIDLAYSTYPQTSYENPVNDILTNLPSAVNLFSYVSKLETKKFVYVSSGGTIYGTSEYLPIDEIHPTNPISPYGITKMAIEKYCGMFYKIEGLPAICVRPSNPYGIGQKPFRGQGFLATAIASIFEGKSIQIYGNTGTIRDYIHVVDLAEGILAVLEKGSIGETYNIGTGIGINNQQLLDIISNFAQKDGYDFIVERKPSRNFDVASNILNCNKLSTDTGWKSTIPIEKGIEELWGYYKNFYK